MELATYVDSLWIVVAGILVMFMQPGFMLVETGFTRSKNSVNIVMKNFMDFSVGAITYWAFGFALAYGGQQQLFLVQSQKEQNLAHTYYFNHLYVV